MTNIRIMASVCFLIVMGNIKAQSPQKFSYQAVVRNASQALLTNKTVGIRASVLRGSAGGTAVYSESHTATTNSNGLVSIEIGGGTLLSGRFMQINWASGPYFLKTEIDVNGGTNYTITGVSQLLSVPYALFAGNVNYSDTSATNELQVLSRSNDTIFLSRGGFVVLPKIIMKDTSATNELQVLSRRNDTIFLSRGGFVVLPEVHIPDTSSSNELQVLSLKSDTLFLSKGGFVKMPSMDSADIAKMGFITRHALGSGNVTYKVGDTAGGGIVFYVNSNGTHGLIAETVDQSSGSKSYGMSEDAISNPANHSTAGKEYHDWRIPTLFELDLMYNRLHIKGLGGFASGNYWSCSFADNSLPIPGWYINFSNGSSSTSPRSTTSHRVRAIRSF
ncbi:MAG: hypothetical protein RIT07_813 [Bacteroidota bacterium]